MQKEHLMAYYLFSPWLRIFHWIMVACITVLFFTGLLIIKPVAGGNPGIEPTFADIRLSVDLLRNIHFVAAYIFAASFIFRIYGFIVHSGDRLFPKLWKKETLEQTIEVQKHYMFLLYSHSPYLRNPMARTSYLMAYGLIAIEMITGFALYGMTNPNGWCAAIFSWLNVLVANEFLLRLFHHYAAWFLVGFAIVHVYMVARADFMEGEGEVSSMFSGIKTLKHEPVDIADLLSKEEIARMRRLDGREPEGGEKNV